MSNIATNYVDGLELRIKELKAELADNKVRIKEYFKYVKRLEAELVEAHSGAAYQAGKQDGIKVGKAERDRLREALLGLNAAIDYHWNDHINTTQRMTYAHAKMIMAAQQIAKQALKGG